MNRSVVFESEQLDELEALAERRGVSISDIVRSAVATYLKRKQRSR